MFKTLKAIAFAFIIPRNLWLKTYPGKNTLNTTLIESQEFYRLYSAKFWVQFDVQKHQRYQLR
ncbi:MAG: hypothetical protein ACO294_10655, partial [Methylococcales bacterium]